MHLHLIFALIREVHIKEQLNWFSQIPEEHLQEVSTKAISEVETIILSRKPTSASRSAARLSRRRQATGNLRRGQTNPNKVSLQSQKPPKGQGGCCFPSVLRIQRLSRKRHRVLCSVGLITHRFRSCPLRILLWTWVEAYLARSVCSGLSGLYLPPQKVPLSR